MTNARRGPVARLRRRVYELLEGDHAEDPLARAVDMALIILIVANVASFVAETVPSIEQRYGRALHWFDTVSLLIFTVEYLARLWSSIEMPFFRRLPSWRARMRFAMTPYALIDLLTILPFYITFFVDIDLRVLRALRLFRLLKLARYSPALHALINAVYNERRALAGSLLLMMIMLLFASSGIYMIESAHQPEAFGSIPQAAWWALATLTTVGYGDVAPETPLGKMFGGLVMLIGLGMFALPIAIISTGFAQEVSRRDFVVTWPLVARIPLLADLDPPAVAALAPYLRAHHFPPNWAVISAEKPADAVFFIASGAVILHSATDAKRLDRGAAFGRADAAQDGPNRVIAATRLRVLELARTDFHRLETASPDTAERVREALSRHC